MTLMEACVVLDDAVQVGVAVDGSHYATLRDGSLVGDGLQRFPIGRGRTSSAARRDLAGQLGGQLVRRRDRCEIRMPPTVRL